VKDAHLTLRLPADLGEALDARAAQDRTAKSQVVREAVVRYLAGDVPVRPDQHRVTARALAERWAHLPHLTPEDAAAFAEDLAEARDTLPLPESPWA
jgi:hypothetical protein